jgi:phage terminase small subunit
MKYKPLTPKQYTFCTAYIKNGFNAYQAALTAGYSKSYATCKSGFLVEHPLIKDRIMDAYQRADNKLIVSWEWKIKKLQLIIDAICPDDPDHPIKLGHARTAIQAISELNKMSGDYAPDRRLNMTVNATLDKLTDARKQYDEF